MSAILRVVVAEGSRTRRVALVAALESGGDIVVVAQAGTEREAEAAVARERPDAVTIDLELPGGGGQRAIERIMAATPVPILVLSSHVVDRRSQPAIAALDAGAADVMPKPTHFTDAEAEALRRRLRVLRGVVVVTRRARRAGPRARTAGVPSGDSVIALGASTGGPQALVEVLRGLRGVDVPILCVQHIHATFAEQFATWLAQSASIPVVVATDGMTLTPGIVHVPPAGLHLRLAPGLRVALSETPDTINRPSIDELFLSVARFAGNGARAALLTGMGADGARGLLAVREAGGATFAQDEATSVIYGMPQVAAGLGAAQQVLALDRLGPALRATLPQAAA
jgi:two-component system chemotaxis response regulator CheB